MVDVESLGKLAEGAGKVVGITWLVGHHGRNALKTWRGRQAKKKSIPALSPAATDAQIKQKEAEAEDGRLVREAVFNGIAQMQEIEDLGRQLALKDQEIRTVCRERDQLKELAEQYRISANEWQQEAADWKTAAKAAQGIAEGQAADWAGLGTSFSEQFARVRREQNEQQGRNEQRGR